MEVKVILYIIIFWMMLADQQRFIKKMFMFQEPSEETSPIL